MELTERLPELLAALAAPPTGPRDAPVAITPEVVRQLSDLIAADVVRVEDPHPDPNAVESVLTGRSAVLTVTVDVGHERQVAVSWIRQRGPRFAEFSALDRTLATLIRNPLLAHLHAQVLHRRGLSELTNRQRQLLEMLAAGYTNWQMARALQISPGTVRSHLQHLYAGLGVNSRGEAVAVTRPGPDAGALRPGR